MRWLSYQAIIGCERQSSTTAQNTNCTVTAKKHCKWHNLRTFNVYVRQLPDRSFTFVVSRFVRTSLDKVFIPLDGAYA